MVADSGAMAMMIPVAKREEPLLRAYGKDDKVLIDHGSVQVAIINQHLESSIIILLFQQYLPTIILSLLRSHLKMLLIMA